MPNWGEVLKAIEENRRQATNPLDLIRKKYLNTMHQYTGRNIICYYSGFLQKPGQNGTSIDDNDKNAFMQAVHKLDKKKGLDLVLHTPGGGTAATESLVHYLKGIFGDNIRAIIPQLAMSAGTMIAFACKEIVMGKQSNLGPIDPHFNGMSCVGVLEEFEQALKQIKATPQATPLWQVIISKYHPTFLGDCKKADDWSRETTKKWLTENMFKGDIKGKAKAQKIIDVFSSHKKTKSHDRHIHIDECKKVNINISELESLLKGVEIEDCVDFQDCVLTLHHCYMHTFAQSNTLKIVENHLGAAMVTSISSSVTR